MRVAMVAPIVLLLAACGSNINDSSSEQTEKLVKAAEERGFYVVSAYDRHDYAIVSFGSCEGTFEFDDRGTPRLRNVNGWDGPGNEDHGYYTIPDPRAEEVLAMNKFWDCN